LGYRSFGECCVDDVNASHLNANDLIVHFGPCCLSTSSLRLDGKEIIYVMTAPKLSEEAMNLLQELISTQLETGARVYGLFEGETCEVSGINSVGAIDTSRFTIIPKPQALPIE
jgi:diphthamide biosynthesis enzyme Dph1/Dph2-like protein